LARPAGIYPVPHIETKQEEAGEYPLSVSISALSGGGGVSQLRHACHHMYRRTSRLIFVVISERVRKWGWDVVFVCLRTKYAGPWF
jgi:hypothetical protein